MNALKITSIKLIFFITGYSSVSRITSSDNNSSAFYIMGRRGVGWLISVNAIPANKLLQSMKICIPERNIKL